MNKQDQYGIRNASRVKIRVDVAPGNGVIVAGQLFPAGVSEQIVYSDQLDSVIARAWTDEDRELWDQAQKIHARKLSQHIASGKKEAEYPYHAVHEFYAMTSRGVPPIKSVEIVGELGAPETPESRSDNQIAALVAALTEALSAARKSKG